LALSSTGCISSSNNRVTVSRATIEYQAQDNPESQLQSPALPKVPSKNASDRDLAEFARVSYEGLASCKITIDSYKQFRRATGGLPK
jgi:hypothetical protein